MTPADLKAYLSTVVGNDLRLSMMVWGAPGIGKSSVIAQVAQDNKLELVDLRLSQLAPTDLRGLPVPREAEGVSSWYPPEFLPRKGKGILFLDELNMAPPTLQGIAQQLILDRRVGSYTVPDGWFIWAAGNRKEDRAAVFEMPAPLANRFVHLEVKADPVAIRDYAVLKGWHEQVISFMAFRPELIHKLDPHKPAWPSPRSWEMASKLHKAGLDVSAAVGEGAGAEFYAFGVVYKSLPGLEEVLEGKPTTNFPDEPSARYACTIGLALRTVTPDHFLHALEWLMTSAGREWVQLYLSQAIALMRQSGKLGAVAIKLKNNQQLTEIFQEYLAVAREVGL